VVWNQDGVAYPGWHGPGWERANAPMAEALHEADHVFFQSAFCRLTADRFLGERSGPSEILYNAVDTAYFSPAPEPPGTQGSSRPLTLLLGGSQYQWYRVDVALRTLASLLRRDNEARLIVTGALVFDPDPARARSRVAGLSAELGLDGRVELTGPFTQEAAPSVYRRADLLLHPKVNDPCPGTVLEAMACGLPVVYSATGGVPELVGPDAGVGVRGPLDFERDHPPPAEELADASPSTLRLPAAAPSTGSICDSGSSATVPSSKGSFPDPRPRCPCRHPPARPPPAARSCSHGLARAGCLPARAARPRRHCL
ncbi:MAG: glycosyltransferase family 4 protein, partial [Deltaproteobacteria bacterium]|nr:glycosyltransferase family 4 protein [Deltaproteobacteria bacterium]